MEIKRLGDLSTETLKNPNYIKEIFYLSPHETHKNMIYLFIVVMQQNMAIIL